jgi:hypothetical protein
MDIQASEDSRDINLWLRMGDIKVVTELILEGRYMFWSLGVAFSEWF